MKKATIQDALKANPCYDEGEIKKLFGRRKTLSPKQIGGLEISEQDKVWALTRDYFLDTQDKAVRFAVFCASQSLHNFEKLYPDDRRPRQAIEAAEAWRLNPTEENKKLAESAAESAESAAWSAAESAAWSARSARSAARSARSAAESAESAAWSAAWSAESAARSAESAAWSAESAAWSAAESAESAAWSAESAARSAESAARSARSARSAAWSAESAARSAESAAWSAESAARKEQVKFLVKMLSEK